MEQANFYLAHEATHAIRAFPVPFDQRRGTTLLEAAEDSEKALLALAAESVARGKYTEIQEVFKAFFEWENAMLGALGGPEEIEVDRDVLQQCPELRKAFGFRVLLAACQKGGFGPGGCYDWVEKCESQQEET